MGKPVIMVVDDSMLMRNMITSVLKSYYDAVTFESGQAAIEHLKSHFVDLILLDYEMPGMTGYDVLLAIRSDERLRQIPVVVLTGIINDKIEAEMLKCGASDYVAKPFRAQVLLTRIRMQLELRDYRMNMERLVRAQTEELREAYEHLKLQNEFTILLLAQVTELRDHGTGSHIQRTTELVRIITQDVLEIPRPGYILTPDFAENIVQSSKLHDVGKIGIPDHILQKPGRLSPEEFEVIKKHPIHGAALIDLVIANVGNIPFFNTARDIALYHHEKWNGRGYPNQTAGSDIPLAARIVAIADVYDAIRSPRPYKKRFTHEQASEIISGDSGSHFDPYIVEVFLRHESEFASLTYE